MTKDEILKLHTLSEEEQIIRLVAMGVIKCSRNEYRLFESLADCAFRLKYEMTWLTWCEAMNNLAHQIGQTDRIERFGAWEATPTNWIQAALLARLEKK